MGGTGEALRVDGVMEVVEDPCFPRPAQVALVQVALVDMDVM